MAHRIATYTLPTIEEAKALEARILAGRQPHEDISTSATWNDGSWVGSQTWMLPKDFTPHAELRVEVWS